MQTINIHEAKTQFSRYVEQAAQGEEIIIARAGKPLARLLPLEQASKRRRELGLGQGRFHIPPGFDTLHAEAIQQMFEQG